eukprot:UN05259
MSHITDHILELFKGESSKITFSCGIVAIVVIVGCAFSVCIACRKKKNNIDLTGEETASWSSGDEEKDKNDNLECKRRNTMTEKCIVGLRSIDSYHDEIIMEIQNIKNKEMEREMEKQEQEMLDQRFSVRVNDDDDIQII